jgi:hypothetical protein
MQRLFCLLWDYVAHLCDEFEPSLTAAATDAQAKAASAASASSSSKAAVEGSFEFLLQSLDSLCAPLYEMAEAQPVQILRIFRCLILF